MKGSYVRKLKRAWENASKFVKKLYESEVEMPDIIIVGTKSPLRNFYGDYFPTTRYFYEGDVILYIHPYLQRVDNKVTAALCSYFFPELGSHEELLKVMHKINKYDPVHEVIHREDYKRYPTPSQYSMQVKGRDIEGVIYLLEYSLKNESNPAFSPYFNLSLFDGTEMHRFSKSVEKTILENAGKEFLAFSVQLKCVSEKSGLDLKTLAAIGRARRVITSMLLAYLGGAKSFFPFLPEALSYCIAFEEIQRRKCDPKKEIRKRPSERIKEASSEKILTSLLTDLSVDFEYAIRRFHTDPNILRMILRMLAEEHLI